MHIKIGIIISVLQMGKQRLGKLQPPASQGLCPPEHRPVTTLPHFLCPRRPHQPSDRGQGDLTLTLSWRVDWFPRDGAWEGVKPTQANLDGEGRGRVLLLLSHPHPPDRGPSPVLAGTEGHAPPLFPSQLLPDLSPRGVTRP